MPLERKLRMAMAGGGHGAFIGGVHRMAAQMDGRIELVAGAFSRDPARSRSSGQAIGLPARRIYDTVDAMIESEASLDESERADFVAIVTPNNEHLPMSRLALESGFHVMCDKPLSRNLSEARQIRDIVAKTGRLFGLTHNYLGYPMVKEARSRVRCEDLGRLRRVVVEYPQGWLATPLETTGHKQASWRADPEISGASGCLADIGTHAATLAEYVTGLAIDSVAADLTSFGPDRRLDDDASILLRLSGGARGVLWASQIAIGEENGLNLRVYGDRGSLFWRQEEPNTLVLSELDAPRRRIRAGANDESLSESARHACRLPSGHPEGFLEGFANVYTNYAATLSAALANDEPSPIDLDFPGVEEGMRGMAFIDAALQSSAANGQWTPVPEN